MGRWGDGDKRALSEDKGAQGESLHTDSLSKSPHLPTSPPTQASLILLIGLPGSGKSSLAQQLLAEDSQSPLISTDAIRSQLFGDEAIQGAWLLVWREVQRQFQQAVVQISCAAARRAIYDATNTQRRHRREVIALARATGFTHVTGLWLNTPVWLCLARNRRRDRLVPEDVIFRMHRQLRDAPPSLQEGLDCLIDYTRSCEYGHCAHPLSKNRT